MSLDFRFTDIPDYETVTRNEDGTLRGVTQCIIFATMAVGVGDTSYRDGDEFVWRVQVYESLFGPSFAQGPEGLIALPEDELRKHVGLRTNVSFETRAAWLKRTMERHYRETITDRHQTSIPL